MPDGDARYVEVPRDMERSAVEWGADILGPEETPEGKEVAGKFVMGKLFFMRFGPSSGDPVWSVDLLTSQREAHQEIFGYLQNDAVMEQFLTKPVAAAQEAAEERGEQETPEESGAKVDVLSSMMSNLLERFCNEKKDIIEKIKSGGHPYRGVVQALEDMLPPLVSDRNSQAFKAEPQALDRAFGKGNWTTEQRPKKNRPEEFTRWVVMKPAAPQVTPAALL